MEYHLKLFDANGGARWTFKTRNTFEFNRGHPGDMKAKPSLRVRGSTDLLDGIAEIRRQVIRYDKGLGVPVYHIQLVEEPTTVTVQRWKAAFEARKVWVLEETGTLESEDPWGEYVSTQFERDQMTAFAESSSFLRWPIVDEQCLILLRNTESTISSASEAVSMDSEPSPYSSSMGPGPSSARSTLDSTVNPAEMGLLMNPITIINQSSALHLCVYQLGSSSYLLIVPGSHTEPTFEFEISHPTESLWSLLDRSELCDRIPSMLFPPLDDDLCVTEAFIVHLDPNSPSEVLSAQINSHNVVKQRGLICLRPRTQDNANTDPAYLTLDQLGTGSTIHPGQGGGYIPPYTQSVSWSGDLVYSIEYHIAPVVALDQRGVPLSVFWEFPAPPPIPNEGPIIEWPFALKGETIEALTTLSRSLALQSLTAIHAMNIAGDQHQQSVFQLLVPSTAAWHDLPRQLSSGLGVLTNHANFDVYNDPEASLVPLAQVGRRHLIHGLTQPPAGIPLAQYHLSGSRRVWIAVANHHRHALFLALPTHIHACYWRHGTTFVDPVFLRRNSIPFTVCVQDPGDVVLLGGSTIYESYDEGWNVVIAIPYLDQQANDTIHDEGLIPLDECSCPSIPERNRVVSNRTLVLSTPFDTTDDMGMDVDEQTMLPQDESVVIGVSQTKHAEQDSGPEDETPPTPSDLQHRVTLALDGPTAQQVAGMLEPEGPLILMDYADRGIIIENLDYLLSHADDILIGEVPRILVDMREEASVTTTRLRTQRLTEEYGGVILQQHPPLSGEWSEAMSMSTIKSKLAEVPSRKKTTIGRLDIDGKTTTDISHQLYRTAVYPLQTRDVSWKRQDSVSFNQWDGLYTLDKFATMPERKAGDPRGKSPFERCWDVAARRLPTSGCPTASFPVDVLSNLTEMVRSELMGLPFNLAVWDKCSAPPYCGGIGANKDGQHVLHLVNHPLQDALAHLPQSLMMIALYHKSRGKDLATLDEAQLEQYQWEVNVEGSGTIFPWGYGGHHRTLFGIHFEDAWMPSANLHIAGDPKVWIFIRKSDMKRLFEILSPILHPCFPFHRSLFIHPSFLVQNKIRFTVARQAVGDMILAGSTSAHLGWNAGPNLAAAANFLDDFSTDIILRDVMDGEAGPWPCACGALPVPNAVSVGETLMNLPRHQYLDPTAEDVGSTIFEWIHTAAPFLRTNCNYLYNLPGQFATVWRYLHEIGVVQKGADDEESDSMSM